MDASHSGDDPPDPEDLVSATCHFDDGRRIRLTFTAAEADEFAHEGQDVSRFDRRVRAWLRRHGKGLAKGLGAVFVLLVGSLAIPAATRQWSDRQQELAIKGDFRADISAASSKTYAQALRIPSLANERGEKPALALRTKLREVWGRTGPVMAARLTTYFDPGVEEEWAEYGRAMSAWIALGCCGYGADGNIETVRSYVRRHPGAERFRPDGARAGLMNLLGSPWPWLPCARYYVGGDCPDRAKGFYFRIAYNWVGQALNDRRALLLERILTTDITGFSSGWRDFLRDLNPVNE